MSTAVSSHSGAGPLSLMSCVRESSPPQDATNEYEPEKNVSTKKKFWNPRKWFKRKSNKVVEETPNNTLLAPETNQALRSRSTSELSVAEEQTRRRSGTPMHPGLSVSHDSVFHSPHSGSELDLDAAQSSSSLSISHQPTQPDIRLQTELIERLRQRRGDTSEDDEGLPHSPCNSPTTTEGHLDKSHNKDHPTKSHSTCSDGSLLSMGSSEMDDDFDFQPKLVSKASVPEKNKDVTDADITSEWGLTNSSIPLNHNAAHHKVSIRPKRTHGAPRRKRTPTVVLPTTPEVNEDTSTRSMTPETHSKEALTELYTSMSYHQHSSSQHYHSEHKMKCSSLPPGLAGPGGIDNAKLTRSRSNAGTGQESFAEEEEYDAKNKETSFFGRFFPRRSGKKKKVVVGKNDEELLKEAATTVVVTSTYTKISEASNTTYDPFDRNMIAVDSNLAIRPNALRTTGPGSRQRIQPIDITSSPELQRVKNDDDDQIRCSPMHDELDEFFQKNLSIIKSTDSTNLTVDSPPKSPPKSPWKHKFVEHTSTTPSSSSMFESKSIVRIAGLSALQQSVMSWSDDTDMCESNSSGFKSLTNLPSDHERGERTMKPVAKSHSFKTAKTLLNTSEITTSIAHKSLDEKSIFKSMSLDSVKNVTNNEAEMDSSMNDPSSDNVTISGPSHKAIVNVTNVHETFESTAKEVSITKVQLNREIHTKSTMEINEINTPSSFVQTMMSASTEMSEVRTGVEGLTPPIRKFSNDNIELIKKEDIEIVSDDAGESKKKVPIVKVSSMTNASHYRKNTENKRDFKPVIRTKSNSFDSVESKSSTPKSSQSSLDKLETKSQENIKICNSDSVVRRRPLTKQRQDDEPELYKVFARRSLKLKDCELESFQQQVAKSLVDKEEKEKDRQTINNNDNKSRDSDKENLSDSSPVEERKKPLIAPKAITVAPLSSVKIDGADVALRKPMKVTSRPFTTSGMTTMKNDDKVLKPNVVTPTRPKTDGKFANITSQQNDQIQKNVGSDDVVEKSTELITTDIGNQDFRMRKAQWEKLAQESIRKS